MIEKYKPECPSVKPERPSSSQNPTQYSAGHFPMEIPTDRQNKAPSQHCFICSLKRGRNGKEILYETRYQYKICEVSLCIVPCFKKYHAYDTV